jgi:YVTN family beta-propeller protein
LKHRLNYRLVILVILLTGFAVREVALELRPSFLRPGLHLFAYVGNTADGTLSAIDLVKLSPAATISVGPQPTGVRANPAREEIWGLSSSGGYAWVLDVTTNRVVSRIPVGSAPYALDFSPDGTRAYVAASGSNTVVEIDCAMRARDGGLGSPAYRRTASCCSSRIATTRPFPFSTPILLLRAQSFPWSLLPSRSQFCPMARRPS